ncbi:MAG: 1-(5-phosphoribosyl)-5-[(5-phosphoribosylamino)methylideneamino]imidazole-4-carboxamide isomerase [Arenimonas sp.]
MNFTIYPAIDIREGRVVRLLQGDYAQETAYSDNPLEVAKNYRNAGAEWLHLVDLDAAKVGSYTLLEIAGFMQNALGLKIQSGGGIRSKNDIEWLLDAGMNRVVVGTLAVNSPERVSECIQQFGADRITVALDTRQDENGEWQLPVKGWTEKSEKNLFGMLDFYRQCGLRHLLCTDIARDGMLSGLNNELYGEIAKRYPDISVQASGGVKTLQDIRDAKVAGAGGAILGRALLEGRFSLQEAIAC